MSHKAAGMVGGGQYEGKYGAGSDDDLDELLDGGCDLRQARRDRIEDERRGREEEERRRLEEERRHRMTVQRREGRNHVMDTARVGAYLMRANVRRYIAEGMVEDGRANVELQNGYDDWDDVSDEQFADAGLDRSFSPASIKRYWRERGVDVEYTGGKAVFTLTGETPSPAGGRFTLAAFRRFRTSDKKDAGIPFAALDETEREVVSEQVEGYLRADAAFRSDRYRSQKAARRIVASIGRFGVARLPLPDGMDVGAFRLAREYRYVDSNGELAEYDFGDEDTDFPALRDSGLCFGSDGFEEFVSDWPGARTYLRDDCIVLVDADLTDPDETDVPMTDLD